MRHPDPNEYVGNRMYQQERNEHAGYEPDRREAVPRIRGLARSTLQMAFRRAVQAVGHFTHFFVVDE